MTNVSSPVLPALPLEMLLYTSFARVGFTLLTSRGVPKQISQAFLNRIVQQHWDAYHPMPYQERAAYICQLSPQHVLFGWLYPDGQDDFGRADVPYFVAHYIAAPMSTELLMALWICIKKGPIVCPERQNTVPTLEPLIIQDVHQYIPSRPGAALAPQLWEHSNRRLKAKELITLFSVHDERDATFTPYFQASETVSDLPEDPQELGIELSQSTKVVSLPVTTERSVPPLKAELAPSPSRAHSASDPQPILQELMAKPIDIQGAVLVSAEGHPITTVFGFSDQNACMLAGTMLYLARQTQDEFQWKTAATTSVRTQEGCILLSHCYGEVYLLVKAGKVPMGLLEGEVNRTLGRLRDAHNNPTLSLPSIPQSSLQPSEMESVTILQEMPSSSQLLELSAMEDDGRDPPTILSEMMYRGRRSGS